ncbi:hypothetical protein C1X24_23555 [Pseudomonas sp. FW305-124]|nr:hypothetical protein C1X24_23555 [Pseudomonas sp. FW305-124]
MTIPLWERSSFSEAAMATVQATQLPTVPPPSQPRRGSTTPTSVMRLAQIPCGSGLARESGVPVTESLTEPPLSQASQLPHGSCTTPKICAGPRSPVGTGLPAKAECQSLNLRLNHRFRRQASSHMGHVLPTKSAPGPDPLWERACPRKRSASH